MVVLAVPNEDALRALAVRLDEHKLAHQLVIESEGDYAGQAMAIGLAPTTDRAAVRKAVSALPLVK